MKKLLFTLVTCVLLFSIPAAALASSAPPAVRTAPAQEQPLAHLTPLTRYFPSGSVAYAALRTDDAFIDTLDGVLQRMVRVLPPDALPVPPAFLNARFLLGLAAVEVFGNNFDMAVRPWLGGSIAVGVYPLDYLYDIDWSKTTLMPLVVAAEITSQEGAVAALDTLVERNVLRNFEKEEMPDYTLYRQIVHPRAEAFMVRDDVLLYAASQAFLPLDGAFARSLAQDRDFEATLSLLPAESYNVLAYLNTPRLLAAMFGQMRRGEGLQYLPYVRMIGGTAIGATILDDNSLTLDIVQRDGNQALRNALGLMGGPTTAINPAFANLLPANAVVAMQITNIEEQWDRARANLGALVNAAVLQAPDNPFGANAVDSILRPINLMTIAFTGLDYERDLANWMRSDALFFAGLNMALLPDYVPIDFAFVHAAAAPDPSRQLFDTLATEVPLTLLAAGAQGVSTAEEVIEGADALVINVQQIYDPSLELIFAVSDDLAIFGTRAAVAHVLSADRETPLPAVAEAQRALLPGSSTAGYLFPPALLTLEALLPDSRSRAEVGAVLQIVGGLVPSATFSTVVTDGNDMLLRLVLTLAD